MHTDVVDDVVLQILTNDEMLDSSFVPEVCVSTFMNWGVWLGVN